MEKKLLQLFVNQVRHDQEGRESSTVQTEHVTGNNIYLALGISTKKTIVITPSFLNYDMNSPNGICYFTFSMTLYLNVLSHIIDQSVTYLSVCSLNQTSFFSWTGWIILSSVDLLHFLSPNQAKVEAYQNVFILFFILNKNADKWCSLNCNHH